MELLVISIVITRRCNALRVCMPGEYVRRIVMVAFVRHAVQHRHRLTHRQGDHCQQANDQTATGMHDPEPIVVQWNCKFSAVGFDLL